MTLRTLKPYGRYNQNGGQAMLIAVIFFLFISLTIILGITVPVVNHIKEVTLSSNSKQSYVLAEALNEDAYYRLNHNKNLSSTFSLSLNGASSTATVTTSGPNKQVFSVGLDNKISRSVSTTFNQGAGVSFNYGVQAGQGGFILNGGSRVNGNVYANGDIVATNGVVITGSAVAANSVALSADQVNNSPSTPSSSINFRDSATTQDLAQSFQVSTSTPINKVQFYLKKTGSPADATVKIVSDSSGSPSTNDLFLLAPSGSDGTLLSSQVGTTYTWVNVVFPTNISLTAGTTYWLVIDNGANNASNYYTIGANSNGYANGVGRNGKYSGTWNASSGLDAYFQIYLGGLTSTIGGNTYVGGVNVGTGSVGDAWAHDVEGASVAGTIYCQIGNHNNKTCDTSRGDPSPVGLPVSDANILQWKTDAAGGTIINGNVTIGFAGTTTGPTKINGNLTINGGGTLTLTGGVWVTGNITVSNGAKVTLSPSYGASSGILLSDGWINLTGGGALSGSGTTGSYLMVLTTSACPNSGNCSGSPSNNALTVTGGAGAVVVNAQNGTLELSGGSGLKEATANLIVDTGGATLTYDSGLANQNFVSGPSGAWNVASWQEVP